MADSSSPSDCGNTLPSIVRLVVRADSDSTSVRGCIGEIGACSHTLCKRVHSHSKFCKLHGFGYYQLRLWNNLYYLLMLKPIVILVNVDWETRAQAIDACNWIASNLQYRSYVSSLCTEFDMLSVPICLVLNTKTHPVNRRKTNLFTTIVAFLSIQPIVKWQIKHNYYSKVLSNQWRVLLLVQVCATLFFATQGYCLFTFWLSSQQAHIINFPVHPLLTVASHQSQK